jgi:3-oxosteroid 1-dehydrogenase
MKSRIVGADRALEGGMTNATPWDIELDILIVGTGAAGLSAALAAVDAGTDTLIVESLPYWGGTTSWSGGGVWAPANPSSARAGFMDSAGEALTYMNSVIGEVGPASSPARRAAFIRGVSEAVDFLEGKGAAWQQSPLQTDYYPESPGGKLGGRTLQTAPFDVKKLGPWLETWNGRRNEFPLPLKPTDLRLLCRGLFSWDGLMAGARVIARTMIGICAGKQLRAGGNGLSARLFAAVLEAKIPVWLSSPLTDLIVEDGAVSGAVVEREGRPIRVRVRGGVVLAAGGFAHCADWREQHQAIAGWTAASDGDQGTVIEIARRSGASLTMMNEAWWTPVYVNAAGKCNVVLFERSLPHGIMVNRRGERFVNESASYNDVGRAMLQSGAAAVPSWLIGDRRLSRRYLYQPSFGGKKGKKVLAAQGTCCEADTLEALADMIGLQRDKLLMTVERFNGFARTGKDLDFNRGESAYDRMYCDPSNKPNANLGVITKGPFTALKLYPGDIGTKGGVLTDEHARVLREDGSVIEGLYAAGNTTASVMGDTYPGGGATLGPAIAFGYLGGRHVASRLRKISPDQSGGH